MINLCIPDLRQSEITAAVEAIQSGWLAHGPYNQKFEAAFAEFLQVEHAVTCNSCASALFVVLKALDITGQVILPSFSFTATANAVVTAGATPCFVDIDYHTGNLDPDKIRAAITPDTQAIMPVHFAGLCCAMHEITALARAHNLYLIEDSAETLGGTCFGRQAGSFGVGCFSFFPTKNITTGEGGMITTNDHHLARTVKTLISHGIDSTTCQREKAQTPWFRSAVMPGYNFRMSNVLAAIGYEQFKRLRELNGARARHAQRLLDGLQNSPSLELPHPPPHFQPSWQMFTIRLAAHLDRDQFVKRLNALGIGASVHFYPPIHQQGFYRDHPEWQADSLEATETLSQRIVTLPMFPSLTDEQIDYMIEKISSLLRQPDHEKILIPS